MREPQYRGGVSARRVVPPGIFVMSGIVAAHGHVDETACRRMLTSLKHRGAEQTQVEVSDAWLGVCYTDEDDQGIQPFHNEDGRLQMVCDGEFYNAGQLALDLQEHDLQSHHGPDVALHLYEEEGAGFPRRLQGPYALALAGRDRFLAARDPLGLRPLYWAQDGDTTLFASELKAMGDYLPHAREFPPGHVWTPSQGLVSCHRLDLPYRSTTGTPQELAAVKAMLQSRLTAAVGRCLDAGGEVGLFLSGGLDSSIVAALATRLSERPLKSFAVGLPGSPDLQAARDVAAHLGTEHHERVFTPEEAYDLLPEIVRWLESFDPGLVRSSLGNYLLAEMAAKHVDVCLSGEGADELFGGYRHLLEIADPQELHEEMVACLHELHHIGAQRVDRMAAAHGLEIRVPFLDLDVVIRAMSLPVKWKVYDGVEKWILRSAFADVLPNEIVWRTKEQFDEGSGSAGLLPEWAANQITDSAFGAERNSLDPPVRNKEELYYYRLFRRYYDHPAAARTVGRWATV